MKYLLEDSRQRVGNTVLFWAKEGRGYTSDIAKAQRSPRKKAFAQHAQRETGIPWRADYIESLARARVDFQDMRRKFPGDEAAS